MTFKAALSYKYYAQRGPIDVESKKQGGSYPMEFFLATSGQSGAHWHLDLIINIQTKLLQKSNLGAKSNLYFMFSGSTPSLSKNRSPMPLRELIFIDATNKFSI